MNWTEPVLVDHAGKLKADWHVYFLFTHEGKRYVRKIREGINREKDRHTRREKGKALTSLCREWLEAGWNPVTDPKRQLLFAAMNAGINPDQSALPFKDALNFALSKLKPKLASKSYLGYTSKYNYIIQGAAISGIENLPIDKVQRKHVKMIMENIRSTRPISNKTYNNYLGTMASFFTELIQWDIIEYNPAHKISPLDEPETDKFKALTEAEKRQVAEHLTKNHYRFYCFLMVVYHTGIRPKEALAMRIRDVNIKDRTIVLVPDLKAENTKTKKKRIVPLNDELHAIFKSMSLHQYPASYFVFGSPANPGAGNRGNGSQKGKSGKHRDDYFKPSGTQVKRDTATKLWNETIINQETGLGINKHMYALKHTGADDKINAGVDLDALRYMYGHSSKQMTEVYAKGIKKVYQENIIQKSPSFIKTPRQE